MPNLDPNVVPFASSYNKPEAPDPKPELSAESIRSKLNNVYEFMNKYQPQILQGMTQAQQDEDNRIARTKNNNAQYVSPIYKIQNEISGNYITGPNPSLKYNNIPTLDYVNTLIEKSKIESTALADPYARMRPTAFNKTADGFNFDRYYSHDKFDELGFSIYRDNERIYNDNSSAWDDFGRMGKKWFQLAGLGAAGLFRNWGKFGSAGEAEDAATMQELLSEATSTRGGKGAWFTNFAANSAYTLGILGEIAAEEFVLGAATSATFGGTAPLLAARSATNAARFAKSMKMMTQLLTKADKAKSFWTAARGAGSSLVKGTVNFLNPLEHTSKLVGMILKPNHAFHRLDEFAKISKTFGAFYKDARAINAVTAESRLEAGFVQNQVVKEAMDAFYKEKGRGPEGKEALKISEKGFAAGQTAYLANAPAIMLSNKLVFGTYMKGFAPIRRMMSKEGLKSSLFKIVNNPNWKKLGTKPFEVLERGLFPSLKRTFSKQYLTSIPSRLSGTFSKRGLSSGFGSGLTYFSANLAEGLQESYQEAVQIATTDYYLNQYYADLYNDPFLAAKNTIGASIAKGVEEQFTMQGLDVFAQGFLMGGFTSSLGNIIMPAFQRASMASKSLFDKNATAYEEYVKTEKERLQKVADARNSYIEESGRYINWIDENVKMQRDLAGRYSDAVQSGNREEAETVKDEALLNHTLTLLQTGGYDSFILHMEDMAELSDEDLNDAFPTETNDQNTKTNREKLLTAIDKAKNIKSRYDLINEKVENPFNPDLFNKNKDPEAYERELRGYYTFEKAKQAAVVYEYTFDRTLKRLNSLANNITSNPILGASSALDVAAIFMDSSFFGELNKNYVQTLQAEIDVLSNGTKEEKTLAKKKKTQLDNLETLRALTLQHRALLNLIDNAKNAFNNPETASEESKEALEQLKDLAKKIAPELEIAGDPTVDPITGQMSMNFEDTDIVNPDVIVTEHSKELLYESYAKYLKNVADLRNVFPIANGIENSFGDFIDFISLEHRAKKMADHITILNDPMSILQMASRIDKALEGLKGQRKKMHDDAFLEYKNKVDLDELLQKLADINVYFDPNKIAKFVKDGTLPDYFINATTGEIIDEASPEYAKIVDLIKEEEIRRGVTFNNKPVVPVKPENKTPAATPPVSGQVPPPDDLAEDETVEFDVTTPINKLTAPIQNKLRELHQKAVTEGANADIQAWMLESPEAASVIAGTYVEPVNPEEQKTGDGKKDKEGKDGKGTSEELTARGEPKITPENPKSIVTPTEGTKEIYNQDNSNKWELTPDQSKYTNESKTEEVKRVSDLKESTIDSENPAVKAAQNRGNFIDNLIRIFATPVAELGGISMKDAVINAFNNNKSKNERLALLEDYIQGRVESEKLDEKHSIKVDPGFYSDMAKVLDELALRYRGYTWHPSLPTMVGTIMNEKYGGTIDLLLELNGKYYIVDLKTSAKIRAGKDMYVEGDKLQQNAYAELFEQITGKSISGIFTLNLISKVASDNKTIQNAELILRKNAEGKESILTPVDRQSVAEQKGQKPPVSTTTISQADIDKRKKLSGWEASYELAKIAKAEGVDLSKMSREEYASYAIKNYLKIDDSQLRSNPKHRNATSVQEVVDMIKADRASLSQKSKDAFDSFFKAMMAIVGKSQTERYLAQNVRLLSGTKDSDSWLFFSINNGTNDKEAETYKSYFSLKDLNDFSPEVFKNFMVELQKRGYNGGVKIFQDLEVQGPALSDQVVMHGYSEADAKLALQVAKEFYGDKLLESSYGKDEVINGKNLSYSQILSDKIKNQVDSNDLTPISPLSGKVSQPPSAPTTDAKADIESKTKEELFPIDSLHIGKESGDTLKVIGYTKDGVRFEIQTEGTLKPKKNVSISELKRLITEGKLAASEGEGNLGQIATAPNPELVKSKFGFTEDHVKAMSKEERELIATATSKEDVKDLVNKYIKPAPVSTAKTPTSPNFNVTLRMASIEEYLEFLHEKLDQLKMQSELNDDPYSNPYLYIADNLPRITPESARKETGVNVGSKQDINPSLLSKNGVSVQKAAELIAANSRTEGLDLDESFIRDEIIEILKEGKNNYKENNGKINKKDIEAVEYEIKVLMDEYEELKKLSSSPSNNKAKAPSRFAGKLIWAQVGTIDPKVFEDYDVIYANDIVDQVAKKMGITPEEGKTIHQTIESRSDKNEILNAIKAEVNRLKKEGKTIISDNWYLKQNADVISSPAASKALFMRDATGIQDSVNKFKKYISDNELREQEYSKTQQKDWVSKVGRGKESVEKQTNLTVRELFEKGTKESTFVEDITEFSEKIDYLKDILAMYLANPEIRKMYTETNVDGTKRILSPEEVLDLVKQRAKSIIEYTGELEQVNKEIEDMYNKAFPKTDSQISSQDKSSAQDAINEASNSANTSAASASDIASAAESKTQKEVDDEFDDSLGCK